MLKLIAAVVAAVFAVGALATPADAAVTRYRSNGWHVVKMNQRQATVTLVDRTPAKTYVWIAWAKKPGPTKCRAKVTFRKGGVAASRVFEKYSRTRSKTGTFYLNYGGRTDKTIQTTITTNGRCIIWAAVK
jgi:hypothetical protein